MSWGINETAPEIEKIKSESADYLNGLNSCGVIDWNTYNYAFDFYADLLMKAYEQGRKDAQPDIIRCKDCKWSDWYNSVDGNIYCYCMETGAAGRTADDYCSYAEKENR